MYTTKYKNIKSPMYYNQSTQIITRQKLTSENKDIVKVLKEQDLGTKFFFRKPGTHFQQGSQSKATAEPNSSAEANNGTNCINKKTKT